MTEQHRHDARRRTIARRASIPMILATFFALVALSTFIAPNALAHHKPDHEQGPDVDEPTATSTATSTATATATVTGTPPTSTATSTPTNTPTATATGTATSTPTATVTGTPPTSTATVTPDPTKTPLAEGERFGWGCGDENHEHLGPAVNPDAESPC